MTHDEAREQACNIVTAWFHNGDMSQEFPMTTAYIRLAELITAALEAANVPVWTTEKPTQPWIWLHRAHTAVNGFRSVHPVTILSVHGVLYVEGLGPNRFLLENASGHWAKVMMPKDGSR